MLHQNRFFSVIRLVTSLFLLSFCLLLSAQENNKEEQPLPEPINHNNVITNHTTIDDLTHFIDGYVANMINDFDPPGMIVSVVIGDQKITKGYGIANVETGQKNDENTLFRIGSISKLFVWLSAHMLADEGKLNLDADINTYLDGFVIEDAFDAPITMRDLMAHRAGFDDNLKDFLNSDRNVDLHEAVSRIDPLRVAPAGERASYSNYGSNLAAYIVESVSGESFYTFVNQRILTPVGLKSVTLRDPDTGRNDDTLDARMAKAHKIIDGIAKKIDYMAVRPQEPVGAVAMSANDAAIFMRMLLNQTRYDGGRLLSEKAWARITEPAFEDAVGSDDMGWGFMLNDVDGLATIGHGGATQFLSWMFIVPELDMGVFISSNMNSKDARSDAFARSIVRRFAGTDSASQFIAMEGNIEAAKLIAGNYLNNRRPQDRGASLFSLGSDISVRATDDGYIVFPGNPETRFAPLSEDVWVNRAGARLRVVKDNAGNILRLHGRFGSATLERISFISSKNALMLGFGGTILFSFTSLLGMYYRSGRTLSVTQTGNKLSWITITSVVLWLSFAVVAVLGINSLTSMDITKIDESSFPPLSLKLLFLIINILCIQTLIHLVALPSIWKSSGWTLLRRINSSAYALLALFSVYLMYHWSLIGGSIYGL